MPTRKPVSPHKKPSPSKIPADSEKQQQLNAFRETPHGALLAAAKVPAGDGVPGIVTGAWSKSLGNDFVAAIAAHRHWQRGAPKH